MKKLMSIILILSMLICAISCDGKQDNKTDNIYRPSDEEVALSAYNEAQQILGAGNVMGAIKYAKLQRPELREYEPFKTFYYKMLEEEANHIPPAEGYKKPKDLEGVTDFGTMLKGYGLSALTWHEFPQNDLEYTEDFLYAYIRGAWEIDSSPVEDYEFNTLGVWSKRLGSAGELASVYCEALGEWLNCFACYAYAGSDGKFYICTGGVNPYYTKDEIMQHLVTSYEESFKLYNQFHEQNSTKQFETQLELARAYYDFLIKEFDRRGFKHGAKISFEKEFNKTYPGKSSLLYLENHPRESIANMELDGIYGLVVLNKGECGPHAELMNFLMNLEGIETYGVCGTNNPTEEGGHIVSLLVLDEENYLCDWGNQFGICLFNECETKLRFWPDKQSIEMTEYYRYKGDSSRYGNDYTGNYFMQ